MSIDPNSNNKAIIQPHSKSFSSMTIGLIVISVVAGIGLICLTFLLVRRRNSNNNTQKNDNNLEGSSLSPKKKKRVFSFSSVSNGEKRATKDVPVSSSLDNQDVFSTLLAYPPTTAKPPTSLQNNRFLEVPTTNTTCSSYSVYEDRRKLLNASDPISASLARQSIEERAGYYRSPTRTPIPYYQHSLNAPASSKGNNLVAPSTNEYEDEDKKAMQRWSATSYHVW